MAGGDHHDATGSGAGRAGNTGGNGTGGNNGSGQPSGTPVSKTLVIELDGVTYGALSAALPAGKRPNLAKLTFAPAHSGGVNSTLSQQPNLDTPGWATLVTGTWADRHQVNSDAPNQALHAPSVFSMLKSAGLGKLGAAVASAGLAALLAPEQSAGNLDSVANCASVDNCVTKQGLGMIDDGYVLVVAQYHSDLHGAARHAGRAVLEPHGVERLVRLHAERRQRRDAPLRGTRRDRAGQRQRSGHGRARRLAMRRTRGRAAASRLRADAARRAAVHWLVHPDGRPAPPHAGAGGRHRKEQP